MNTPKNREELKAFLGELMLKNVSEYAGSPVKRTSHAEALLAALEAAGLRVVPIEPEQEMQIEGLEALVEKMQREKDWWEKPDQQKRDKGDYPLTPTAALTVRSSGESDAIYAAMLAASPYAPGEIDPALVFGQGFRAAIDSILEDE